MHKADLEPNISTNATNIEKVIYIYADIRLVLGIYL